MVALVRRAKRTLRQLLITRSKSAFISSTLLYVSAMTCSSCLVIIAAIPFLKGSSRNLVAHRSEIHRLCNRCNVPASVSETSATAQQDGCADEIETPPVM